MISLNGGVIGILLWIILVQAIRDFTGIPTIITLCSVLVSFGISVTVSTMFGYLPAKRVSLQDPLASLRYESWHPFLIPEMSKFCNKFKAVAEFLC